MIRDVADSELPKILAVDDERAILRFLRTVLVAKDFLFYSAESGQEALNAAALIKPDIVLLDLGLPDMDGIDVIRRMREWLHVPIIVISVREREDDKVVALDAGADDYMTKPFGIEELLARIRVALRRVVWEQAEPVFVLDNLEVDFTRRKVITGGQEVQLTPTEYDLLRLLVTHAGKVITQNQILKQLWGVAYIDQPQVLRVNISNLRRKLEPNPSRPHYIITEPGVGYFMRAAT